MGFEMKRSAGGGAGEKKEEVLEVAPRISPQTPYHGFSDVRYNPCLAFSLLVLALVLMLTLCIPLASPLAAPLPQPPAFSPPDSQLLGHRGHCVCTLHQRRGVPDGAGGAWLLQSSLKHIVCRGGGDRH